MMITIIPDGERVGVLGVECHVAVDELGDVDRDEIRDPERLSCRVGGKGVAEQQHHEPE